MMQIHKPFRFGYPEPARASVGYCAERMLLSLGKTRGRSSVNDIGVNSSNPDSLSGGESAAEDEGLATSTPGETRLNAGNTSVLLSLS